MESAMGADCRLAERRVQVALREGLARGGWQPGSQEGERRLVWDSNSCCKRRPNLAWSSFSILQNSTPKAPRRIQRTLSNFASDGLVTGILEANAPGKVL